jgi:hypothetical protein
VVDPIGVLIVDQGQHLETRAAHTRLNITVPTADLARISCAVINREDIARRRGGRPSQDCIAFGRAVFLLATP